MQKVKNNLAKSKAHVIMEDEYHPDPVVAAQAVDERAYHLRGELAPWEEEEESTCIAPSMPGDDE